MAGDPGNYKMYQKGQKTAEPLTNTMLLSGGAEGAIIHGDSGYVFLVPGYKTYDYLVTGVYEVQEGALFVNIDGEEA